jgi:hypothetical protein
MSGAIDDGGRRSMNRTGRFAVWPAVAGCVLAFGGCGGDGEEDAGASGQRPADRSGLSELVAAGGDEAAVARTFAAFGNGFMQGGGSGRAR